MEKNIKHKDVVVKVCQSLINPTHKLEVSLIGCGGTGSEVLKGLARMDIALESLGHPGLFVTAHDHDVVELPNIGRQLFSMNDIGKNKATCLIEKINRFHGFAWESSDKKVNTIHGSQRLIISCVDNVKGRKNLYKTFKENFKYDYNDTFYWMDFGNGDKIGQVVLGSTTNKEGIRLHSIGDIGIPDKDDDDTPSCSLAEALTKQDLMINPMIANAGLSILWDMFRSLRVNHNVAYLNLEKMKMNSSLIYSKTKKHKKR